METFLVQQCSQCAGPLLDHSGGSVEAAAGEGITVETQADFGGNKVALNEAMRT